MSSLINQLSTISGLDPETINKLIYSFITLTILIILRLITVSIVNKRTKDVKIRYNWRKSTTNIIFILWFFILGRIWLIGFSSLATYLGLLSAGIAIALRDPLVNLAAWNFYNMEKTFYRWRQD